MRGQVLTPYHVLRELGRLLDVFPRPKWWPKDDETVARRWTEIGADVSAEQFTQAVTVYLRGEHQFAPKAPALLALARRQPGANTYPGGPGDARADFDRWLRSDWSTPCPACGESLTTTVGGRYTVVHQHARHAELGLPCVEACDQEPPADSRHQCLGRPLERGHG